MAGSRDQGFRFQGRHPGVGLGAVGGGGGLGGFPLWGSGEAPGCGLARVARGGGVLVAWVPREGAEDREEGAEPPPDRGVGGLAVCLGCRVCVWAAGFGGCRVWPRVEGLGVRVSRWGGKRMGVRMSRSRLLLKGVGDGG